MNSIPFPISEMQANMTSLLFSLQVCPLTHNMSWPSGSALVLVEWSRLESREHVKTQRYLSKT